MTPFMADSFGGPREATIAMAIPNEDVLPILLRAVKELKYFSHCKKFAVMYPKWALVIKFPFQCLVHV